jgi:hypothetical protein
LLPDLDTPVVICGGKTCQVDDDDAVCCSVSVESTATLQVASGYVLGIYGESATSDIDGTLEITGEVALNLEGTNKEHTFTGDGEIKGTASSAKLSVDGGGDLTTNAIIVATKITGAMTIDEIPNSGSGGEVVLSGGTLHANINGTLVVQTYTINDQAGSGGARSLIKVSTNSNAVLRLDRACDDPSFDVCVDNCLEHTDFEVFEGILDLETTMVGKGCKLTGQPGGEVRVDGAWKWHWPSCGT